MPSGETRYSVRFPTPETIQRGRANALACDVYAAGSRVVPTSGTISIYDSAGTSVVTAAAVTVASSGACSYTTGATAFDSYSFDVGWRVEWSLTIGGTVYSFPRDAMLVRRVLYPVITDADLLQRHPDLGDLRDSSRGTYQNEIDEAWWEIQNRLIARGQRPQLILDSAALRAPHLYLTLSVVFLAMHPSATGDQGPYLQLADRYREQYERAWAGMSFPVDNDEDGVAEAQSRKRIEPPTFLGSVRGGWR